MLYIVGTPIGNLEDITFRAINTLKNVSHIFSEDTRVSKKLLNHYGIETKLQIYHEHNKDFQIKNILNLLLSGKDIALITDAGMPCISDPGYELVNSAYENDIDVTVIPGPSALITASSISGLDMRRIAYEGFLPKKKNRQTTLNKLKDEDRSIVIFESPHRIVKTLEDLLNYLGNRYVVIARELTKMHEEVIRGRIEDVLNQISSKNIKGEIVLVVKSIEQEKKEIRKARSNEY